jgi:hypothetical protein
MTSQYLCNFGEHSAHVFVNGAYSPGRIAEKQDFSCKYSNDTCRGIECSNGKKCRLFELLSVPYEKRVGLNR